MRTNRKVRIHYWSSDTDSERSLTVAPYDLRYMRHGWYLLANSEEQGSVRIFKISRIRNVEILPERFRFPRHFSADAYFTRAWEMFGGTDEEITVRVRFAPQVAQLVAESRGRQFASMELQPDGTLICTAILNSTREISWWILSFGSMAEVLSPPELRADFARIAHDMNEIYSASETEESAPALR